MLAACSGGSRRDEAIEPQRNAASVLPEPVGRRDQHVLAGRDRRPGLRLRGRRRFEGVLEPVADERVKALSGIALPTLAGGVEGKAGERAGARQDGVEHRLGEAAGEGVLLARVVAGEQRQAFAESRSSAAWAKRGRGRNADTVQSASAAFQAKPPRQTMTASSPSSVELGAARRAGSASRSSGVGRFAGGAQRTAAVT